MCINKGNIFALHISSQSNIPTWDSPEQIPSIVLNDVFLKKKIFWMRLKSEAITANSTLKSQSILNEDLNYLSSLSSAC